MILMPPHEGRGAAAVGSAGASGHTVLLSNHCKDWFVETRKGSLSTEYKTPSERYLGENS